jgi:hypothetical protein
MGLELQENQFPFRFNFQLNDVSIAADGTETVTGPADISSESLTDALRFQQPGGQAFRKTPSLTSGGVDGKLHYDTGTGDLVPSGAWQAQIILLAGTTPPSDVTRFTVLRNVP